MTIVNLTIHPATKEQREAGVIDLQGEALEQLKKYATFEKCPEHNHEILDRAGSIAGLAKDSGADAAMIGGALWLMGPLTAYLQAAGIKVLMAFSERKSVEVTNSDGSVTKTSKFVHKRFIEVNSLKLL